MTINAIEPVAATPLRADATGASAPSLVQTSASGASPHARGWHLIPSAHARHRPADHRAPIGRVLQAASYSFSSTIFDTPDNRPDRPYAGPIDTGYSLRIVPSDRIRYHCESCGQVTDAGVCGRCRK